MTPTGKTWQCFECNRDTSYDQMTAFGARCKPCFDAYCAEAPRSKGFVGAGRPDTISQAEMRQRVRPGPHPNVMGGKT